MQKTYKMNIAGLERELPLCPDSDSLDIAAFIIFGDVELTVKCAEALIPLLPEHDIMLTAEAKSIPLIHELAKQQGENEYIIARKGEKVYMPSPISVNVRSITTQRVQTLYLGSDEAEKMKGKRVLIIDDVISTGESLKALEALVSKAGGKTVGRAAVLAEGDAADRKDIIFLERLPVFPK